jgi:hypothetical protein
MIGDLLDTLFCLFSPKNATGEVIGELLDLLLEPFHFLEQGIYCQLKREIKATPLL